ncbi:MAG: TolC family protein [Planctomycetes bacterium]|nr:TolC family protein [Planctomycetota bacterium]
MRRLLILVLCFFRFLACAVPFPEEVKAQGTAPPPRRAHLDFQPCDEPGPMPEGTLDLPGLWSLALANNPALREAAAEVEAARGRLIQAGKYPNPRLGYRQEELGTRQSPAGSIAVEVNQEIVTAGKRRLDVAIATRGTDVAAVASLGRKFDVLTAIRRDYYDYLGWRYTAQVQEEVVTALQEGVAITRRLVEVARTRPRTDLLRLQALLEEAESNQARTRVTLEATWRQLAAEVGLPQLPMPSGAPDTAAPGPLWDAELVTRRVIAANTELQQAALEAERDRLEVERARAEAVPNFTLGGGYSRNFPEHEAGAIVSVEAPLPLWDRNQGRIFEAQARLAKTQAAQATTTNRLSRDTAEAFGRYLAARQQADRLAAQILPGLTETLDLVRQGYQVGATEVTFADVLLAEQALNDARLRLAETRRDLWRAVADLEGLMQLDVGAELCLPARSR